MSIVDVVLAVVILGIAGWIFYLTFMKKKGSCSGCSGCSCTKPKDSGKDHLVSLS